MHIDAKIAINAIETPDWNGLMVASAPAAYESLKSILRHGESLLEEAETRLTVIREHIFNLRMCAFRIISDRELWKLDLDPEYGVPFKSMFGWLQRLYPNDDMLRYAVEANSTQKALPAATVSDLSQMKRCNAVLLARPDISDTCKNDHEVIEATKTATEKQFREKINIDHGQHVEQPETRRWTLPRGDWAQIDRYLEWVSSKANLESTDHLGALLYLAVNENEEHDSEEKVL